MYYVHVMPKKEDSSTQMMEGTGFYKMLVALYRAIWHYIPENHNIVCMYTVLHYKVCK
jgi:hypothetical protein